ncbi:unnamed protein product [Allacma fusca]|uniref:Uncharacterized protein n=1 Tax=Allacma fusca TaxID=39272 RepID=A0A8J2J6U5_9HEXA|nr:unnamed protein product [Allacma fusca]
MDQQLIKNVTKTAGELGATQSMDRKAGTSERRKMQMKWCEDQRFKLQREYALLEQAKKTADKLLEQHLYESSKLLKIKQNLIKQLSPGESSNPVPEGAFNLFTTEDELAGSNDSDSEFSDDEMNKFFDKNHERKVSQD